MSGRVLRLDRVSRNVADLERAVAFYCEALGFQLLVQSRIGAPAWGELMGVPGARARTARLRLGAQELELAAFDPPGRAYPAQANAADLCFQHLAIVVSDMAAAYAQLGRYAVGPISQGGPQTLPPDTGNVSAFKFRDPEGHPLELIHFPTGVGAPCWQHAPGLFLGIDHSAIAVADAGASLAFYASMGWQVAGRSRNRGPAQDRLDGLRGVDVDVIGLEPAQGGPPHLELLGYRVPQGRSLQPPAASNDLAADRLVLAVEDLPALLAGLPGDGYLHQLDGRDAAFLRDPSGHRLLLQAGLPLPG
ncbi:VOC family protein [Frateuria terrea]|uniref:Catechol 2,3-dioxygenase n=1 Tax=Frateuria terrea TaxID=529704 RepID=A0A1H6YNQ0_9GAMM|nr:VOC family protein [Frateuria terrea]SEJ42909.1 Catechol 2,3-dioxygenase [Frateuria terrea]SFP72923.1 Catechol 2,3-dioxygenase [Frateuria terrea]